MPAVTRKQDKDLIHCSTPEREGCSSDVKVNKKGVSRKTDMNTIHQLPGVPCPNHTADIQIGSTTVFANKLGVGRIGDQITACTAVAQGSEDAFSG